jgi:hypothetical protein
MNIPRTTEVTLTWQFGGYNADIYEPNPKPVAVTGIEDDNMPAMIQQVQAILSGSEGLMIPQIAREPMLGKVEDQVSSRLLSLVSAGLFSGTAEWGGKRDLFSPKLRLKPRNGVHFTDTAQLLFEAMMVELLGTNYNKRSMPVPQVRNRDLWLMGDYRIPVGAAMAMDRYYDDIFSKACKAYTAKGVESANRILLSGRRLLANQTRETTFDGAELLVGCRRKYSNGEPMDDVEYCFTLFIDGWPVIKTKGGSHASQLRTFIRDHSVAVLWELQKYGLSTTRLVNGYRIRHTNRERVQCQQLGNEQGLLSLFLETLTRVGIGVME